ncbi:malonyl-CoA:Acyl carrier protein transacylase [Chloropicon primus]|uniref:Malonyl-CoA:Acyl carrier protein transacylase n=1 Tax=Chloropicon primus TaxID=1764295 RepID=A0A5B8ML98_9CHLO|nr:malonyl-CoA:Acyl carrier protein transacylase [Chloropicon primus]UPR00470.1 malonyl-CoA:Acyl carrier protein transacylase [Chloropicon primus]|eukprot:QDZ21256.1 malonyl-CoA:Acyl carrier protein transacylase [Chloropicon primus]
MVALASSSKMNLKCFALRQMRTKAAATTRKAAAAVTTTTPLASSSHPVVGLRGRGARTSNHTAWLAGRSTRTFATAVEVPTSSTDGKFAEVKPSVAFFFPGQGAQSVGMCGEVCEKNDAAKKLFEKASEVLGYDLLDVCVNGPADKLNSTAVSQPAIFVASMAAVEELKSQDGGQGVIDSTNVAAGLSLGEYTALCFAGALSFEDGLKIVKARGEAMQAAADSRPTAMCSVIGLKADKVEELCKAATEEAGEGESVQVANFLCNGNYAVSGTVKAIEVLEAKAKPEFKARMTVRLAVAGAFHTKYMDSAVEKLQEVLSQTEIKAPRIPVYSNVDAKAHSDPEVIKSILAMQVTSPVQWETTLGGLLESGLETSYELGPGKVVAGIMKRIDKKHKVTNVTV